MQTVGLTDVEIVYSDQAQEAESFFWFDSFWKSLENGSERKYNGIL
jgi:hypothetical protein